MRALTAALCALGLLAAASLATPGSAAAATTFVVNRIGNQSDLNLANAACDVSTNAGSQCTLRAAIQEANDTPGADTINFNVTSASKVIAPTSPLPPITDTVLIDGYTQPGASPNTQTTGNNAVLRIVLDGVNLGAAANGLVLDSYTSEVRGLNIQRFGGSGIVVGDTKNNVNGNFIGTNVTATARRANGVGVTVTGRQNTVGTGQPAGRNVISGNTGSGIVVSGEDAVGTVIINSYIGTNRTGVAALANGSNGVHAIGTSHTRVGASSPELRNVISGNTGNGVKIDNSLTAADATVMGNYIGTNAAGTADLGNGSRGVAIEASEVSIGADFADAGNVISGNGEDGIVLSHATDVRIIGNRIGTSAAGTAAIPNAGNGVSAIEGSSITVGEVGAGLGNQISGNGEDGIDMSTTASSSVRGNLIGLSANGTSGLGNAGSGVALSGCSEIAVGGDTPGERNVISANGMSGVSITGTTTVNIQVEGNRIGTTSDGTGALGNTAGVGVIGGTNVTIGGDLNAEGNVIAFNHRHGVALTNAMTNALVQRNTISSNTSVGILGNSVVGATVEENNIVANGGDGVRVTGNASRLRIVANLILNNGELGIDLVGGTETTAGVTANDLDDPDTGPNGLQNFPVLTSAVRSNQTSATTITGTLNSNPSAAYTVHVYAVVPDPSGHGEGQAPLASQAITTSASGDASFNFQLPGLFQGQQLTATATRNSTGTTSEFSANRAITAGT